MWTIAVYARALIALLIPVGLFVAGHTGLLAFMGYSLINSTGGLRLLVVAGAGLALVELFCVSALLRLALAGGRIGPYQERFFGPAALPRRHRRRLCLAAGGGGAAVALMMAEGLFRLAGLDSQPPRSQWIDEVSVDNTLNAFGIRETWDAIDPGDHRLRIGFLGDSMTYGFAVERDETFSQYVGQILDPRIPGGVLVINLGESKTGPAQQVERYLAWREFVRPDIVAHVVYLNDLDVNPFDLLRSIYDVRDAELVVGSWSYVLRFAERQVRFRIAQSRTLSYFRGGRNRQERERAWRIFTADVRRCKAAVEEGGARYVMVLFPWLARLEDYPLRDTHEQIRNFAAELGVPYLDLLDTFQGRDARRLRISSVNEHPNPAGHRLAAEAIAAFLQDHVLGGPGLARRTATGR